MFSRLLSFCTPSFSEEKLYTIWNEFLQLPSACSHYILIKTSYSSIPSRMEGLTASYSHITFCVSNLGKFTWVGCVNKQEEKKAEKIRLVVLVLPPGKNGEWRTEGRHVTVGDAMATVSEGFSEVQCDQPGFCCKCGTLLESLASVSIKFIVRVKAGSVLRL